MKKQYINPAVSIVKVEAQAHMLFGSATGEGTINGGGSKGTYSGGQLSRESGWDDED
ncbi:MAG: hypothetical protein IJT53_07695 [Prevotella sp.]|nr:hypothetical protein [Prevotella sp.]